MSPRSFKGFYGGNKKLERVRLSNFNIYVEDADSLILSRKGFLGIFSKKIQIRLAGLDAPEVGGHTGDPIDFLRIFQSQSGGDAATKALKKIMDANKNASVIVDREKKTYGRYLGVVVGDKDQNINLSYYVLVL